MTTVSVHRAYEADLNGETFTWMGHAADMPAAWPCEVCGHPVWVGTITCTEQDCDESGHPLFDVWERRTGPDGHPWLGPHHCEGGPPWP